MPTPSPTRDLHEAISLLALGDPRFDMFLLRQIAAFLEAGADATGIHENKDVFNRLTTVSDTLGSGSVSQDWEFPNHMARLSCLVSLVRAGANPLQAQQRWLRASATECFPTVRLIAQADTRYGPVRSDQGFTALHALAAWRAEHRLPALQELEKLECAHYLVTRDEDGNTPLHVLWQRPRQEGESLAYRMSRTLDWTRPDAVERLADINHQGVAVIDLVVQRLGSLPKMTSSRPASPDDPARLVALTPQALARANQRRLECSLESAKASSSPKTRI